MRSDRQVVAIERLLEVVANGASPPSMVESTLEAERYTSPSRLEAEKRVLFRKLPFIVGRESDLADPGSFFTHDAAGVALLVTRDPWGKVHAMLNMCRHRGARLVCEENGNAKRFVCAHHSWTYDLCGRMGHIPLSKCLPLLEGPSDEHALLGYPCETRHGFIWVQPSVGTAFDVAGSLGDFDDDLASFKLADHVVFRRSITTRAVNWKLVMARFFPARAVVIDTSGTHLRSVVAGRNLAEIASSPRSEWDVRTCATVVFTLFPNSLLVFHGDTVSHIALFPHGLSEVRVEHTLLAPSAPTNDEEHDVLEKTWDLIDRAVFANEDLAMAERIPSVLDAEAQPTLRLDVLEHPIRFFHDAIDRTIAAHGRR